MIDTTDTARISYVGNDNLGHYQFSFPVGRLKGMNRRNRKSNWGRSAKDPQSQTKLRIIGGQYGGRQIEYSGDQRTRPMKERVREAMFNLVGPWVKGTYTIDLFAGTGAVGLESVSRGSLGATLIEKHFPTARIIKNNIRTLELESIVEVVSGDAFHWLEHRMSTEFQPQADIPWTMFFCPPYKFFLDRQKEMLQMIQTLMTRAPENSHVIVESDTDFSEDVLPYAGQWDVRPYPPAVLMLLRKFN